MMVEEITVKEAFERGYLDWVYYDKGAPVAVEKSAEPGRYWLRYQGGVAASVNGNATITAVPRVAERVRERAMREGVPGFVEWVQGAD